MCCENPISDVLNESSMKDANENVAIVSPNRETLYARWYASHIIVTAKIASQ